MLKRQACAKFQSQIFDESEVIQILKVVRWHFCQVYTDSSVDEVNLRPWFKCFSPPWPSG